jgi:hypothetical protein
MCATTEIEDVQPILASVERQVSLVILSSFPLQKTRDYSGNYANELVSNGGHLQSSLLVPGRLTQATQSRPKLHYAQKTWFMRA